MHYEHYTVCPPKGYPLRSSASAACSNLNAFNSLMSLRMRIKRVSRKFLMLALQICSAEITQNTVFCVILAEQICNASIKILCSDVFGSILGLIRELKVFKFEHAAPALATSKGIIIAFLGHTVQKVCLFE